MYCQPTKPATASTRTPTIARMFFMRRLLAEPARRIQGPAGRPQVSHAPGATGRLSRRAAEHPEHRADDAVGVTSHAVVADTLGDGWVVHLDRHADDAEPAPCGAEQDLGLEVEAVADGRDAQRDRHGV